MNNFVNFYDKMSIFYEKYHFEQLLHFDGQKWPIFFLVEKSQFY